MPAVLQEPGESSRKLGVDEKLHAAPSGTTRPPPAVSAPNSSAARRVALKVGIVWSTSSIVMPDDSNSSRFSTGYRIPRTVGWPWQTDGSDVMRDNLDMS